MGVKWEGNNDISIKLQISSYNMVEIFYLLAYSDSYKSELMGNWRLEIYSFQGLDLKIPMGKIQRQLLYLTADSNCESV